VPAKICLFKKKLVLRLAQELDYFFFEILFFKRKVEKGKVRSFSKRSKMAREENEMRLNLFKDMQTGLINAHNAKLTFLKYYTVQADTVVTLLLSRYFKNPGLSNVKVPYYLDDTLKALCELGMVARTDGACVNFVLGKTVIAVYNPADALVFELSCDQSFISALEQQRTKSKSPKKR